MKQLTGTQINECTASQTSVAISKPCDGLKSAVNIDGEQPTTFLFTLADVKGYDVNADGSVVIHFKDTSSLTIPNFKELAEANYTAKLEDGTVIQFADMIGDADAQGIVVDFTSNDIQSVTDSDGKLVIVTKDGERHEYTYNKGDDIVFADGASIKPTELEELFQVAKADGEDLNKVEPAAGEEAVQSKVEQKQAAVEPQMTPEQLAAIETAAGQAAPAGGLGNTGAGFGSRINGATIGPADDVGPIGPTSLQFGIPEGQLIVAPPVAAAPAIVPPNPPSVAAPDRPTSEDTAVTTLVTASPSVTDGSERITVEIIGIPASWTITDLQGGVYDVTTGIWTIALPPGATFSGGPTLLPPVNSDVDLPLVVRVTNTSVSTGLSTTVSDGFTVIVDAVVDTPNVTANNVSVPEDTSAAITISTAVTDTDGSESVTGIVIRGVPANFSLSAGTRNPDGSYTLTPAQLAGLTVNSPANYSGTINLTVDVTVRDNPSDSEFDLTNNQTTISVPLNVTWTPVADAPVLVAGQQQVLEDGSVTLAVSATLVDRDGSESMVVEIVGIPTTWTITDLKGGTYDPATGIWRIAVPAGQDFAGGPTIAPPANSDIDLPLTLRATTTDGTDTETVSTPFKVIVDAVADNVNLAAADVSGKAGTTIDLNVATSLKDTDGSEEITSIKLLGIPSSATLSAGTKNADGSWSLTQAQLAGLKMTLPSAFAGFFDVTVQVDSREKVAVDQDFNLTNNNATLNDVFRVTVSLDAVPPTINVNGGADGQVYEDQSVLIPVSVIGNGTANETMVVTISNLPAGWAIDASGLTGGTPVITGTTITINLPANTNLGGAIRFTPPVDSDVDSPSITITAVATEPASGDTASSNDTFIVEVDAVADVPILMAGFASGTEDTPIPLDISSALDDRDGSESLAIIITGVPVGATLSLGTKNADGSWTIIPTTPNVVSTLAGLTLTPPANFSGTINLTLTAVATETLVNGGVDFDSTNNVASYSIPLAVTVNPRADDPAVTITPAQVYEDQSVTLNVQATPTDPSESVTVRIGNLQGWTITDLKGGTYDNATGVWSITMPVGVAFNGGPVVAPNANSDINRNLPVTVITTDGTSTNSVNGTLPVVVDAVADNVNLTAAGGTGNVGGQVAVNIATSLKDTDGSEEITSVKITGIPNGVTLSAGTKNADGSWSLTTAQLAGLKVNGGNYTGSFTATVTVDSRERVATDSDFDLTNNTASNSANFTVAFNSNPPTISINGVPNGHADGQVYEDNSVLIPISVVGNGSALETMVVTISGLPTGWGIDASGLTGGTPVRNGSTITISLPANTDLGGAIRFTPPANSDVNSPSITVTAVATEPSGQTSTDTESFIVVVDAVADNVNLTAAGGTGNVGGQVAVNIATSLKDTDGSEEITSVKITGIPNGVTLSAGTKNADGSWSLTTAQLAGLKVNGGNYTGSFTATVTVDSRERVATDSDFDLTNNTASNSANFTVAFNPNAQPPVINVDAVQQVFEDNSVLVPISVVGQGTANETMVVTISGLPTGWTIDTSTLTGGTAVRNGSTITITLPANTNLGGGLTMAPPANSDVDSPTITITAVSTDNGTTATATDTFYVLVDAVADLPNLTVQNASGNEDTSIPLTINSSLTDTDGSETLSLKITGVPAGASLSAGTKNADGSWTLTPAQLTGLRITPAANFAGTITLTIAATAHENAQANTEITLANNDATRLANLVVTVNPVADTPTLTTTNTTTLEDTPVTVNITANTPDPSESMTVTITNITNGWTVTNLNGGTFNSTTGTWTITVPPGTSFNGGPTLLPPPNSDVDRTFPVTVTTTDGTDTETTTGSFTIIVDAVVDTPTVTVTGSTVNEDNVAPISISATVGDPDGSERVTAISITGIPAGFNLSAGTKNADGSWSLTPGQLAGLTITPPANYSGTINAVVHTTIYDQPSDQETTNTNNTTVVDRPLVVTWNPVADAPVLNINANQQVYEDGQVTIAAQATLVDRDGSESMRVDIVGIPSTWTITGLNGGTYNAATQTWSIMLAAGQDFNGGPTIRPPHDSDVNLPLTLTATTFDGPTSTSTTSTPFNVVVDAVWDGYTVTASGGSAALGNPVGINIGASAIDIDGSERITGITITGVPAGVNLSAGTKNPDGSWSLTTAQLSGLTASSTGYTGSFTATVRVNSAENVTDSDFDLGNNAGHNDATFTVAFNNVPTGPTVTIDTSKDCVFEDTKTLLPFSANFGGGDGDEVMTVTVTGLPTSGGWVIDTGGVGTLSGGTWTITLPAGTRSFTNTTLHLTPPANSDIDYNNIQVTASLRDPNNGNAVTTDTKAMPLEVDAVADGINVTTTSAPAYFFDLDVHRTGNTNTVTFAAPFNFSYLDGDGSERITSIVPTGIAAQYLSNLYINTEGQLVGTLTWTGGRFSPPDFTATFQITTTDTPHDNECTTANNTIVQNFNIAFDFQNVGTPLVLDLDGNGIQTHSIDNGVLFDMNNDGTLDHTAWIGGNDAFLAFDNNGDGIINNQSELFGEGNGHKDGFGDLATLDSNGDGKITADDTAFGDLRLWKDVNHDGVSQGDEMFSLTDFHITSIDLDAASAFDNLGDDTGYIMSRSTYTTSDGATHEIADVAFVVEMGDDLTASIHEFVNTPDAGPDVSTAGAGSVICPTPAVEATEVLNRIDEASQPQQAAA